MNIVIIHLSDLHISSKEAIHMEKVTAIVNSLNMFDPFDGIIKVEKILVSKEEVENGMDSDLIDFISAHLINERNPVCYGSDLRWANHLYPVYLTERYVKSHYLSTASFLHLF